MAAAGEPLRLVLGYAPAAPGSQDLGRWVIERVEEIQRQTWQDGAPRRQDFRLRLAAYPDALDVEALTAAASTEGVDDAAGRTPALQAAVDGALLDARRFVAPILEEGPDIDRVAPDLRRNAAIIDGIAKVWRRTLAGQVRARVERALPGLGRSGDLAATVLRSVDGDVLDGVVWRHYGRIPGAVEQVLAANPGLAALGPVLPPGTRVELPELRLPESAASALRLGGE